MAKKVPGGPGRWPKSDSALVKTREFGATDGEAEFIRRAASTDRRSFSQFVCQAALRAAAEVNGGKPPDRPAGGWK